MLADRLALDYLKAADQAEDLIRQRGLKGSELKESLALVDMDRECGRTIGEATRYWLSIKQAEMFRAAHFDYPHFPPIVHDNTFIEFDGLLEFKFRPWQRPDFIVKKDVENLEPRDLRPRDYTNHIATQYQGVQIRRYEPPHRFWGWPECTCVRITWYEKPRYVYDEGTKATYPLTDSYIVSMARDLWPAFLDPFHVMGKDEDAHPGEMQHRKRLLQMSANLMYFLAAENVVKVRIRPEHRLKHDKELRNLPKSNKSFYVLPYQLLRYKYLHPEQGQSGRHLGVCFDVRGHFRHLSDERYRRNDDGSIKSIWIDSFTKGKGNPYRPKVYKGTIDSLFLDYDKFIREETKRYATQPD